MKNRRTTLRSELLFLCLIAFAVSFVFYRGGSSLILQLVSRYYDTEAHVEQLEKKYIGQLQDYIQEEEITIGELSWIDDWVLGKEDVYLKLFDQGGLIYDTMYGITDYSEVPMERAENYSEAGTYKLQIGNREICAVIFCYDFLVEHRCETIVLILAVILFFIIILLGVKNKIDYLAIISNETAQLRNDLGTEITLKGKDEIYQTALEIDRLRTAMIARIEGEREAYQSNIALITALSHDLKTPLTSVISYIELAAENVEDEQPSREFLNIALEKAMHLRSLTKNLFEHFLLKSQGYQITLEKVNGNELVAQMVEENLLDLEAKGALVLRTTEDVTSALNVNVDLIYSVFENIFSNIYKYGDLKKEIEVEYHLKDGFLEIGVRNKRSPKKNNREVSAKIGLENCKLIMERHGGSLKIMDSGDAFQVVLQLPIA